MTLPSQSAIKVSRYLLSIFVLGVNRSVTKWLCPHAGREACFEFHCSQWLVSRMVCQDNPLGCRKKYCQPIYIFIASSSDFYCCVYF